MILLPSGGKALEPLFKELEIVKGTYAELKGIHKFGFNPDIDIGAGEDVIGAGGLYPWIVTAGTASIVSNDVKDDVEGVGGQKIVLDGLDENGNIQIIEYEMDGTTPVVTTGDLWLRCPRAYITDIGSELDNAGTITVTVDSKIVATITPGTGQTLQCVYTIPLGYTGYIEEYYTSPGANAAAAYIISDLITRENGKAWRVRERHSISIGSGIPLKIKYPIKLLPLTDIRIHIDDASDVNNRISATMEILLVKD